MTNTSECPEWVVDIGPLPKSALRNCYADVANCARNTILNDLSLMRWHRLLCESVVPLHYYAGSFRQDDPEHVCLGRNVEIGHVAGADYHHVPSLVRQLSAQLRASVTRFEIRWPTITRTERAKRLALIIASLIGEFIRIHPFLNGNGRVSRVAWRWGLLRFGVSPQCRIAPRPTVPYPQLMEKCMNGDDGLLALAILQHLAASPPIQST